MPFASYMSQEITNVDKFGSSDEEDDDDDISFTSAPDEPPPPPPLPLNITRHSSATTATNPMSVEAKAGIEVEGEAESDFNEEIGEFTGDAEDSSDDDDELIPGGHLRRRRRPSATHEAKKRDVLEEDEGEADLISEVKALGLTSGDLDNAADGDRAPPAAEGIETNAESITKGGEAHDTK